MAAVNFTSVSGSVNRNTHLTLFSVGQSHKIQCGANFFGKKLVSKSRNVHIRRTKVYAANSADFGNQEALKFKEDFLKTLKSEAPELENVEKIAEISAEVIKKIASSYDGKFDIDQFLELRAQLEKEGLQTQKPIFVAISWARSNLFYDWKLFSK